MDKSPAEALSSAGIGGRLIHGARCGIKISRYRGSGAGASVILAAGQHRPPDASHLVSKRYRDEPDRLAVEHPLQPFSVSWCFGPGETNHAGGADDQEPTDRAVAGLGDPAEPVFAPAGVLPGHQAQPSRQVATRLEGRRAVTVAARTDAVIGPTPGMVASFRLFTLVLCQETICFSRLLIRLSQVSICPTSSRNAVRASSGRACSSSPAINALTFFRPWATTMPNSAKWARKPLISMVRWRTKRSRVRCNIRTAC